MVKILLGKGGIIIYEQMKKESQRLDKELVSIQEKLRELPEGKLVCARNGKHVKWYRSDGHHKTYISKKDRKLAEQLAAKKYLSVLSKDLMHEKNAIEYYLRHHRLDCGKIEQMLLEQSELQKLLSPYFKTKSQELEEWISADYERNTKYADRLLYKGLSGTMLRSKSELLIEMQLYTKGIPFRYECALNLNGVIIYPDFTIRHPRTGKLYYWEHFGMMDDSNYVKTTGMKLQQYMSSGIIPSIQLITTYESYDNPLGVDVVNGLIEQYFLN